MPEELSIVAGVDVGGTTMKARAVRIDGHGLPIVTEDAVLDGEAVRSPTPTHDPQAALQAIARTVRTLTERVAPEPLGALGVVVPGIIDEPNGIAVFQAQLGWDRLRVVERLGELTGLPVALGHDVRGGGLAEWRLGAGRGTDDLLFVMLGTGVGAAAVVDGRLLTADGYAGQLGHIEVRTAARATTGPDELRCGCGQHGCLGTLASASAVVRRYAQRSGNAEVDGRPAVTEAREVAALARAGDPDAVQVWDEAVEALAAGLADAVTLYGSSRIVLGGGLALAGDQLASPVAEHLRKRLSFHRRPEIRTAELGDESAILGAALLAARAA